MTPRKSTPRLKKRLCDDLWRRLIVAPQQCARCGTTTGPFEAAHIVRRRFSWTRSNLNNGWCLCHACHTTVDTQASAFYALVRETIGMLALEQLEHLSLRRDKFDWWAEHERLKAHVKARTP